MKNNRVTYRYVSSRLVSLSSVLAMVKFIAFVYICQLFWIHFMMSTFSKEILFNRCGLGSKRCHTFVWGRMFSWMFHTWYGSRMGTRFMTFLFHHMFDSIHHLSTSVLVHLLLWWVKLLDYQVNKYNKWRQSWFWARNVQLFHFGYRFAGTDPPEESPSQPEDGSQFIAPIFWRRVFQWLMPTVLAGTTTKPPQNLL